MYTWYILHSVVTLTWKRGDLNPGPPGGIFCSTMWAIWPLVSFHFLLLVFSFPHNSSLTGKEKLPIFGHLFENKYLGTIEKKITSCQVILFQNKEATRGLRSRMPFPENQIFPKKIWKISRPEHSGTYCIACVVPYYSGSMTVPYTNTSQAGFKPGSNLGPKWVTTWIWSWRSKPLGHHGQLPYSVESTQIKFK